MASIIAAFSKPQDAGNIRAILRKNGYEPVFACTSGAQVLAAAESLNGGIVVCGFRFEDMVCEELRRLLPSSFDMLLIASPAKWSKRDTEVRREDIRKHPELMILAESDEAGVFLVMSRDGRQIFVQGHPEYDRMTLNNEYHRDLKKGLDPALPCNYYENNDPFSIPALTWRNTSNTLYTNWLNFYVYQITPYLLDCEE